MHRQLGPRTVLLSRVDELIEELEAVGRRLAVSDFDGREIDLYWLTIRRLIQWRQRSIDPPPLPD